MLLLTPHLIHEGKERETERQRKTDRQTDRQGTDRQRQRKTTWTDYVCLVRL